MLNDSTSAISEKYENVLRVNKPSWWHQHNGHFLCRCKIPAIGRIQVSSSTTFVIPIKSRSWGYFLCLNPLLYSPVLYEILNMVTITNFLLFIFVSYEVNRSKSQLPHLVKRLQEEIIKNVLTFDLGRPCITPMMQLHMGRTPMW